MGYIGKRRKHKARSSKALAYSAVAVSTVMPTTTGSLPAVHTDTFPRVTVEKSSEETQPYLLEERVQTSSRLVDDSVDRGIVQSEIGAALDKKFEARRRHLAAVRAEKAKERARLLAARRESQAHRQTPSPSPRPSVTTSAATTASYTPSPNISAAQKAIAFARAQIGKPYIWGGTGPSGYDCSGLVMAAWAYAGVAIPRTSEAQWAGLRHVSTSAMQPGDILVFYSGASHVGLYVGGGMMIEASEPGRPIAEVSIAGYYMQNLIGVVRP